MSATPNNPPQFSVLDPGSALPKPPLKLLYVVNIPRFFLSHRLPLASAAREAGYETHIAAADHDQAAIAQISELGFQFHPLPLSQHGLNPLAELRALLALRRLYAQLRPDLLHHVSLKPVIYGGIAARMSGIPAIQALSGLGYLFSSQERKAKLLARLMRPAFRLALSHAHTLMIFQNPDDRRLFLEQRLISSERARVIRGSGVDECLFSPNPQADAELPVMLFAGRLLWQKGLGDFIELARRLHGQARFLVAGYEERGSPSNISAERLAAWQAAGLIEWLGKRDDMPEVYAGSHIVCLPSTYGEGVPKTLIEAAACARPCLATDTPGCREIVQHGVNGLLVPPHDIDALEQAARRLIGDASLRKSMGENGRQIVLDSFTARQVIDETLALYRSLLAKASRQR